jgi:uncharacterized protein
MKLRFGSRREANRRQRHPAQGPNVLQALLQNGADVDVTDHAGETAMFRLVRSIDPGAGALAVELVKIMLDAGADPNARNNAGKTPLGVATPIPAWIETLKGLGFSQ